MDDEFLCFKQTCNRWKISPLDYHVHTGVPEDWLHNHMFTFNDICPVWVPYFQTKLPCISEIANHWVTTQVCLKMGYSILLYWLVPYVRTFNVGTWKVFNPFVLVGTLCSDLQCGNVKSIQSFCIGWYPMFGPSMWEREKYSILLYWLVPYVRTFNVGTWKVFNPFVLVGTLCSDLQCGNVKSQTMDIPHWCVWKWVAAPNGYYEYHHGWLMVTQLVGGPFSDALLQFLWIARFLLFFLDQSTISTMACIQ